MSLASAKRFLAKDPALLSEAEWSSVVVETARIGGWTLRYHTWRAKHSPAGFPDWVFARLVPHPRLLFVELKTEVGKTTDHQDEWLEGLRVIAEACVSVATLETGASRPPVIDVHVWRPSDWPTVVEVLTGRRPREESA